MVIYKITNLINSKVYIGQTTQDISKRINQHFKPSSKSCRAIGSAIKKYGRQNFKIEIIDKANNLNELTEKEVYWITKYNSIVPNGYNLKLGTKKNGVSSETRQKMSKNYENKELWLKISTKSKENWQNPKYRENISNKRREMWKTPEYRQKMAIIREINKIVIEAGRLKGLDKSRELKKKKILGTCIETGIEVCYKSISEAVLDGFLQSQISRCCAGKSKTHRGYYWRFI